MKRILPLVIMLILPVSSFSQLTIPNGGFENWLTGNNTYPKQYPFNSNKEAFFQMDLPVNITKSYDAYHGSFAVKLETVYSAYDTAGGYFVNSQYTDNAWHGGIHYNEKPTRLRGYYKSNIATGDSALIVVSFSKAGANIGMYMKKIGGVKTSYTLFDFELKPALTQTPDSVIFGATSSDLLSNIMKPGSTLIIDSISFKGVSNQPADLFGDFEIWESELLYKPANWHSGREGVTITLEAHSGSYAAELKTTSGFDRGVPAAQPGKISTGYYSDACNCMLGGYPYTLKKDTLVFYYNYTPSIATDSGAVYINFKKNGNPVFGAYAKLPASALYRKFELPFDIGSGSIAPDSVIVEIQSSLWSNRGISYAGAVLRVDDINFKSQMITTAVRKNTLNRSMALFPNPTGGRFTVQLPDNSPVSRNITIEILNITGQKVMSSNLSKERSDFDISVLPKGLYIAKIMDGDKVSIIKIVKR